MQRKNSKSKTLKLSLSQEKKLTYTSQFLRTSDTHLSPQTPKLRSLINNKEFEGLNDTCTFQSNLTVSCGVQTDPVPCYMESLVIENQSLYADLSSLKTEILELKNSVKHLLQFKKQARLKANQDIIEMLQAENLEIKKKLTPGKTNKK